MEPIDVDEVTIVPDSPDKSAKEKVVRLGSLRSQNCSSGLGQLGKGNVSNGHSRNRTSSSNIVNSRQINPPRGIIRSGRSGNHASSLPHLYGSSSSYRSVIVRKEGADNDVSHENNNSDNVCCIQNKKPFITSQSFSSPDRPVVHLIGCSKEPVKFFQSNLGVTQAGEFRKGSASEDARSSRGRENSPLMVPNGSEERDVVIVDSIPDSVVRVGNHYRPGPALLSSDSVNLPKPSRQKRLVRNGCISPINIAKGKQPVEMNNSGSRGMEESDFPTAVTASRGHIPMENTGDYSSRSLKGKEVLVNNSVGNRMSASINEKANGYSTNRDTVLSSSGLDGWRTTHRQSSRHNFLSPLSGEVHHIPIEDDSPSFVGQASGNKAFEGVNNDDGRRTNDLNSNTRPSRQTSGQPGSQFSRTDGSSHKAHITLGKRKKQESIFSTHAECSRSTVEDLEIVEISPSRKVSRSQFNDNLVPNGLGNIGPVINLDEVIPEQPHISSHSSGSSFSNEDARATQLELDERLAHELQEQIYNEEFTVGTNEIDSRIALSLQQEASRRTASRGRRPVSNPRGSSSIQFSSRFPPTLGRGGASAPSRFTRARNVFTGRARTLSSSRGRNSNTQSARLRNSMFPSGMDVETRMRVLEALESFNDMGVGNSFLQMQRDFNENDYESLLALDDNNHQHAGATAHQINALPESTVQTESLEEACSICLDTPAMGDVIRHLPCFHKFHKDCIDPWLRRRTNCPVCKSSVT